MITEETFILVAMKHYDNPQCITLEEFQADLKRFLWIKKLLNRYHKTGELVERIILNHLITLYNIFGDMATQLLFFKLERELWNYLATFLLYIQRLPEQIKEQNMNIYDFEFDEFIIERLRVL